MDFLPMFGENLYLLIPQCSYLVLLITYFFVNSNKGIGDEGRNFKLAVKGQSLSLACGQKCSYVTFYLFQMCELMTVITWLLLCLIDNSIFQGNTSLFVCFYLKRK